MTRLCELRNAIVHGDRVPEELWEHEGHSHLNHMHDRLISTLRIVAANEAGDDLLRIAQSERAFVRAAHQAAAYLREARARADASDEVEQACGAESDPD
jgi:hypothetical protein